MVCDGEHLCQQPGRPIVFDIIVKTKSCSGCATGNTEQGLQVQLSGLLGLTECTTDNLDNPDAHDYASGSVAHFGKDSGLGGCGVSWANPRCAELTFPSTRLTSTKLWTAEALPGRERERGHRRARTPSVSTSMGTTTKTTVASWERLLPQQTDSNLSQIAIQLNQYYPSHNHMIWKLN